MAGPGRPRLTAVVQPVFIKKKHELDKVLKAIEKGSVDAVELLVNTMNSEVEDESQKGFIPLTRRLECAQALLNLQVKVADVISRDQFARQIAEVKVKGLPNNLEISEKRARINFTEIQDV
jgi:hypothetical protein